jgi:nucleotide-binding universal stress UspA family protein
MTMTRMPRVVVGVDDSLAGLQALRCAVAEARRRGLELRAIRAWQLPRSGYAMTFGEDRATMADAAAMTVLRAFQSAMGGLPHDISFEALAVEGPAAKVLADQAYGDDLLVVGRSRRRLFGPPRVDVQCVRRAACQVLVVGAPSLAQTWPTRGLNRAVVSAAESLIREATTSPPRPND